MTQTKPVIEIVNVVASATIEQPLDLYDITKKFPSVEYEPEQFPGAIFRIQNPKTTTLIFRSGKMVCTGGKSKEMAVKAVNTVVQNLRKGKIKIKNKPIVTIQNIVSSINLGGKVSLEQAARVLLRSMDDPEQFPGVIHSMLAPKTVILIFASGKIVCAGAKQEDAIHRSVNSIHSELEQKNLMVYEQ